MNAYRVVSALAIPLAACTASADKAEVEENDSTQVAAIVADPQGPEVACFASDSTHPTDDWLIVPGYRVGLVTPPTTELI